MAYSGLLTSRSDYSNFGGMLASMEENASQVTSENEQNNTFFDSLKIQTEAFGLQEAIPGLIESATSAYGLVGNVIKLGSSFGKLKAKLTDAGEQIKDLGGDALNQGKRLLGKTKDTLQSSYEEGSNLITTTSDDLLASGRQFVSTATEQVANLSDTVRNEANNLVSTVTDEAGNVLNTARQEASGVVQTAQSEGSGLLTAAQEQVGGLAESVQTQGRDALLNATRSTPEATAEPPAAPVTEADKEADFTNPTFYGGGQSVGETQQIFSNPLFDATSAPSVNEITDFSEIVANVNPRNLSSLVSSRINPASGGGDNLFQSSNMFDLGREAETTAYRMSAPYASAASNVTENLGGAASTAAENLGGAASTAAENAYASFSNLTASAGGAAENVGGAASAALENVGGAASGALENLGGAAS